MFGVFRLIFRYGGAIMEQPRRRRKKRKTLKRFFAFFVLILFMITAFSIYEYRQGLSESDGDFGKDGEFTFNSKGRY
jgi:polyisoprenyl-teichoic acid--peptidoglycan teichoic acid transferase